MSDLKALTPGTWTVDASHSNIGFTARPLMVAKVRGKFTEFTGTIEVAGDPLKSTLNATVEAKSIDTGDEGRGQGWNADVCEADGNQSAEHHELALGEVDDLGGLVDQDETQGNEPVDASLSHTADQQLQQLHALSPVLLRTRCAPISVALGPVVVRVLYRSCMKPTLMALLLWPNACAGVSLC